ncbi:3-carboxyethylcatechol 2,3-dioxygenase [Ottowia thiooxydans]|uniref:3-carboxyethylcatechol 2,3-dioxygenase n=1 Tax=Ottowia thiooxydans TaxID=219182 RepID=UPI0004134F78|nr:3-carboxyethylcatechol 2,3-dioxygenase [Ottowia thiooxydans]
MPVQMICCSHSPLMLTGIEESQGDAQARFIATMEDVSQELHAFSPDLVVVFAPDHFNGFFYELMPPFCIGAAAEGSRDWGAEGGPLRVPRDLAVACVRHLHGADFDISLSYDMKVDHGLTIPLIQVTGALARYDVLPIFINCAGDPRPSMRRVRQLGAEIGRFLAGQSLRVAVLGSGGLSHDPPTPRLAQTSFEVARRLIKRATPSQEELQAREARVVKAARDMVLGRGPCKPPDVQWDDEFMQRIVALDHSALDAITDAELDSKAGFGGHEVRTWVAAAAACEAMAGRDALKPEIRYYQAIPEWLTGMGVVTAQV